MSNKDFEILMNIADVGIEKTKTMSKKEAILSLNRAGILTKKGKLTKTYAILGQPAAK